MPPDPTRSAVTVRPVRRTDLDQVIAIDATVTGLEKRSYWERVYRRYGLASGRDQRHFLVALAGERVVGFLIGEVRDWEFGSPPCGWVFAIDVDPAARQGGVGAQLLAELSERFRRAGVIKLRTLLARDNTLVLSFFRSQGMMAGPLIPLEMDLAAAPAPAP
jgi:ribosomal protein S18 acetylase RimI-like enzyme